jgi:hypothetical protein
VDPRSTFTRVTVNVPIAALQLVGAPATAFAAPPPPNPSDGELAESRAEVQNAAQRVGVLANRLTEAGAALDAAQLELAQTYDEVTRAQRHQEVSREAADDAQAAAEGARVEVDAASAQVQRAQRQVDEFVAASYRQGSAIGSITAYLGAESPQDLLARAELLNAVSGAELDALDRMSRVLVGKANLDSSTRAAAEEAAGNSSAPRKPTRRPRLRTRPQLMPRLLLRDALPNYSPVRTNLSSNSPTRGVVSPVCRDSGTSSTTGRLPSRQCNKNRLRRRHSVARTMLPHPVPTRPWQVAADSPGWWRQPPEPSSQPTAMLGQHSLWAGHSQQHRHTDCVRDGRPSRLFRPRQWVRAMGSHAERQRNYHFVRPHQGNPRYRRPTSQHRSANRHCRQSWPVDRTAPALRSPQRRTQDRPTGVAACQWCFHLSRNRPVVNAG